MTTHIPTPARGKDRPEVNPTADTLREMARMLSGSFIWEDSAEGHAFWAAVRDRFNELARIADAKANTPPPLPDPPARPSSLAAACDMRDTLDSGEGIEVDHHPDVPGYSLYTRGMDGWRHWFADYEIGTNDDQYTAEEAEALAYEYAERLLEACPQLRAHGINPKG